LKGRGDRQVGKEYEVGRGEVLIAFPPARYLSRKESVANSDKPCSRFPHEVCHLAPPPAHPDRNTRISHLGIYPPGRTAKEDGAGVVDSLVKYSNGVGGRDQWGFRGKGNSWTRKPITDNTTCHISQWSEHF